MHSRRWPGPFPSLQVVHLIRHGLGFHNVAGQKDHDRGCRPALPA